MPDLPINSIVSFSSEDPTHCAANMLKADAFRKWNCRDAGEKQASVILQLDKASQIHGVDIGNDWSAFIEVLVSRSGLDDSEYKVLLVMSSFMSPSDSKNGSNVNRVRMFGKDNLNKETASEKWDRVKVVCTQPYNQTVKYGLSFIRLMGPSDDAKSQDSLGAFKLRTDASDDSVMKVGSVFGRRKSQESATPSVKKEGGSSGELPVSLPKKVEVPLKSSKPKTSPFSQIMRNVTFVLSGFPNPYRGELRDKALAMGAKYVPDWNRKCTHLICAFPNTPKYKQVQAAGGIIVQKEWILDSHKQKVQLPAQRYGFVSQAASYSDSSDSEPIRPISKKRPGDKAKSPQKRPAVKAKPPEDNYSDTTEEETEPVKKSPKKTSKLRIAYDSESEDTDDEIQRVRDMVSKDAPKVSTNDSKDGGDTDIAEEDDYMAEETLAVAFQPLPDLFTGLHFLLYGDFSDEVRRRLKRYIAAYNGTLEEYMKDNISYVITSSDWDSNFDKALSDNSSLQFVRPKWVFSCHEKKKLLPYQRHAVIPQ